MPFLLLALSNHSQYLGAAKSSTSVGSGVLPNNDHYSLHKGKVAETSGYIRSNADRAISLFTVYIRTVYGATEAPIV